MSNPCLDSALDELRSAGIMPTDHYERMSYVYFISTGDGEAIKIGRSIEPLKRIAMLQAGTPEPLEPILIVPGGQSLEAMLHKKLKPHRIRAEWFRNCPEVRYTITALHEVSDELYADMLRLGGRELENDETSDELIEKIFEPTYNIINGMKGDFCEISSALSRITERQKTIRKKLEFQFVGPLPKQQFIRPSVLRKHGVRMNGRRR